jgi:hypothetical protein
MMDLTAPILPANALSGKEFYRAVPGANLLN